jgi:hypothetical protein
LYGRWDWFVLQWAEWWNGEITTYILPSFFHNVDCRCFRTPNLCFDSIPVTIATSRRRGQALLCYILNTFLNPCEKDKASRLTTHLAQQEPQGRKNFRHRSQGSNKQRRTKH